jgi:hypothetical protein
LHIVIAYIKAYTAAILWHIQTISSQGDAGREQLFSETRGGTKQSARIARPELVQWLFVTPH